MAKKMSKIKEIIKNNTESDVNPLDLIKPGTEWASGETYENRMGICKACPELIKLTHQCKKCGCFMAIKTKIQKASCPLGKW